MAELVDAQVSDACGFIARASSSLVSRTKQNKSEPKGEDFFVWCFFSFNFKKKSPTLLFRLNA